jgi:hypothetical protein
MDGAGSGILADAGEEFDSVPSATTSRTFRERMWGGTIALLDTARKLGWVDLIFVLGVVGLLAGLVDVAREWVGEYRPAIDIDRSPSALPLYTSFL